MGGSGGRNAGVNPMIQFVEHGAIRLWSEGLGDPGRPCAT